MSRTDYDYLILLYDRERYGGETWEPSYRRGDARFSLNAFARQPGAMFHQVAWTASARTHEEARRMVPPGGVYFDRTGNFPSPMVPIEGWGYKCLDEIPPPTREQRLTAAGFEPATEEQQAQHRAVHELAHAALDRSES